MSLLFGAEQYTGSTKGAVTLAGAIIKAKHKDEIVKKYKRKDCPVCKGKGWYMSGDGIKRVDCGYCEPDNGAPVMGRVESCKDANCSINNKYPSFKNGK